VGLSHEWQALLQSFVSYNQNPAISVGSTFSITSADFDIRIYWRQGYARRNKKGGRFWQSPFL
jgi:hypothetical protein